MKYFIFFFAAIVNSLVINSSDSNSEEHKAYLRLHAYEMMGRPIKFTTKKKEDGLFSRDLSNGNITFNPKLSETIPENTLWIMEQRLNSEFQNHRTSRKTFTGERKNKGKKMKKNSNSGANSTIVHQSPNKKGSEPEIYPPTTSILAKSTKFEESSSEENEQNLSNILEREFKQIRNDLGRCHEDGVLQLRCYYELRSQIFEMGMNIQSGNFSEKAKGKVREEFSQTLLKMLPMEKEAREICSRHNFQWEECFYFNFEAYGQEIQEIERRTGNILQEFNLYKDASRDFFKIYKPKIETQISRFKVVTGFSAEEWRGDSGWDIIAQAKEAAADHIANLQAFWKNKRIE